MLKQSIPKLPPETGSVGGIDVGWSKKRASSAVACIKWDKLSIDLIASRFRAIEPERFSTIVKVLNGGVMCAAIDGPLCTGLSTGSTYRFAERVLTLGFQPFIGKPGQTSSPNGRLLNEQANITARLLAKERLVESAIHDEMIHSLAIVEAFPTSFLGLLLPNPNGLKSKKRASSDVFYDALAVSGALDNLVLALLPGRALNFSFAEVRNHDDRAAIICALTALCVASGNYTAVGDNDGWIILPPYEHVQPWAHELFEQNATRLANESVVPKLGMKLGLLSGMYREQTLEEINALDDEIVALFSRSGIDPELQP